MSITNCIRHSPVFIAIRIRPSCLSFTLWSYHCPVGILNLSLPSPEWKAHGPRRCNKNDALQVEGTGVKYVHSQWGVGLKENKLESCWKWVRGIRAALCHTGLVQFIPGTVLNKHFFIPYVTGSNLGWQHLWVRQLAFQEALNPWLTGPPTVQLAPSFICYTYDQCPH